MDVRGLSKERAGMIKEFYWSNSGKNIDVETIRKATYCVVCQENKKYTAIGLVYNDEQKPLYWTLKDLVVDSDKRNLGIGSEIIEFLKFDLPTIYNIQHKSKQGIIATIPLTNKRLVNFFEKLEFIQTEVSHRNKEIDQWTKQFNNMNAESIESDFIFIKSK